LVLLVSIAGDKRGFVSEYGQLNKRGKKNHMVCRSLFQISIIFEKACFEVTDNIIYAKQGGLFIVKR
jgi:hypothetical protein